MPFFWYVAALPGPDDHVDNHTAFDMPADSLIRLNSPNIGQGGAPGGGLCNHQGLHRAGDFMHMDDHDFAFSVEAHQELWHPLETLLSNWIELLRLGKITASPRSEPSTFGSGNTRPWESVSRDACHDIAEEGFRLLLPFGLVGDVGDGIAGAQKSDASFVTRGNVHELFQNGYKPFWGRLLPPSATGTFVGPLA